MTPQGPPKFEETPLTRVEYITALAHFYRGEIYRATQWRLRLDNTTNWSLLSVMGLVTFSLGEPNHPHSALLLGMGLLQTFLHIEARRFRFFDLWQSRVRLLERNFYGPVLRRDLQSPTAHWGQLIADDLLNPRFKMSRHQAVRTRLVRNYGPLFLVLLAAWGLKLAVHPEAPDQPWGDRMAIGGLPWWLAPVAIALQYGYLVGLLLVVKRAPPPERGYAEPGHADEVALLDL